MPLLETDIETVETVERGEGEQVVLLFHASATVPAALIGLMKRLEAPGRRLLAPAAYRCGATKVNLPDGTSFAEANLAIAKAVLRALPTDNPVLFGHSKGGVTALRVALETTSEGKSPASLILFEPILYPMLDANVPAEAVERDWDQSVISTLKSEVAAGNAGAGVKAFVEAWNDARWEDLPEPVRAFLVSDAQNLADEAAEVIDIPLNLEKLSCFEVPTLILCGEKSPTFTRLAAQNLEKHLPNATLKTLTDVGHMGPINRSDLIAEAISAFIPHP